MFAIQIRTEVRIIPMVRLRPFSTGKCGWNWNVGVDGNIKNSRTKRFVICFYKAVNELNGNWGIYGERTQGSQNTFLYSNHPQSVQIHIESVFIVPELDFFNTICKIICCWKYLKTKLHKTKNSKAYGILET